MLYLDGEPVISVSFASTIVQKKVQRTNLEKKLVNERLLKSFFIKRLCPDKEERGDGGGGGGGGGGRLRGPLIPQYSRVSVGGRR